MAMYEEIPIFRVRTRKKEYQANHLIINNLIDMAFFRVRTLISTI